MDAKQFEQITGVSPEEATVRIAEFCGYKTVRCSLEDTSKFVGDRRAKTPWIKERWETVEIPDYLHSRDAIAEAVGRLNDEQKTEYVRSFLKLVDRVRDMVFADAMTRAAAFYLSKIKGDG